MQFLDLRNNPLRIIHLANIIEKFTGLRYLLTSTELFCCILPSNLKGFFHKMICKGLCSFKLSIFHFSDFRTLEQSVKLDCRTCHTCQIIGKPNQGPEKAPLKPIPVTDELFSKLIIDCVGLLPKTKSGKKFLLTVMCSATRFPEAFPLRNIESKTVCEALKGFFCTYGFPKVIQTDRATNFLAKCFKQLMSEMGV